RELVRRSCSIRVTPRFAPQLLLAHHLPLRQVRAEVARDLRRHRRLRVRELHHRRRRGHLHKRKRRKILWRIITWRQRQKRALFLCCWEFSWVLWEYTT